MSQPYSPQRIREVIYNVAQHLRLRRRNPWNWLVQTFSLALLPLGLVSHNIPLLALSVIGIGCGFFDLPLPPMDQSGLKRLVPLLEKTIGWENTWLARPMDKRKKRQIIFWTLGLAAACWFLWDQDLGPIGLAIGTLYLLHVRRENIKMGIKP